MKMIGSQYRTVAAWAALMMAGASVHAEWTVSNALDVPEDLAKVSVFDVFTQATGAAGTLTLIPDPTGTLKNPDGSPAIVVEAKGSQTNGARFVQSYNFPAPAPTSSVYTFYYRWMYPTSGVVSWQELAPYSGESEIGQTITRGNGIWYHNWWDLAFAYNGGGTWAVGSPAGTFSADTWYEYWLVVDPANVSFDWYIRGGTQWPEITPVFLDGLYVNLDLTLPLKALQEVHVMGQEGFFGPQYYDAMFIDTAGENLTTPADLGSIFGDAGDGASNELVNISTRGLVGLDDEKMIGGFVVSGETAGGTILIRGIGPTLAGFGVPNTVEDPIIQIFDGTGTLLLENDDWGDDPDIAAAGDAVGAFALEAGSTDAALLITDVPVGSYTVQLGTKGTAPQNGLLEVYKVE